MRMILDSSWPGLPSWPPGSGPVYPGRIIGRIGRVSARDQAFFLDTAGQLREVNQQPGEAERDYRDAIAFNDHYALARFHPARLLARSDRTSECLPEVAAFLGEWSQADEAMPEVREAKAMLAGNADR